MRISYSSFETYNSCPLKYKFSEIDKIKTPKSKEAVFGTLLHSVMKFIHNPGILSPTLEQAMQFFMQNWNTAAFDDSQEERAAFSQGAKIIQDYYQRNNPADFNIANLESRFSIEIGNEKEKHFVTGIIDRIDRTDDGWEIIDYKTTKKMPTQERVENDTQLSIYLKGFLAQYPDETKNLDKIKVSLYFLKHGVKLTASRTFEQLEKSEKDFLETISKIEESKFEPTPSVLCDWCGFKNICPMWKHKFKESRKYETDEINAIIDEFINLKSAINITKERIGKIQNIIESYMDQEGVERLFSESGIISRNSRKTYKYDEKTIKEILEPLGHWEEIIRIDTVALKNLVSGLPLKIRQDIEKARTLDKESKSLVVKKGKG